LGFIARAAIDMGIDRDQDRARIKYKILLDKLVLFGVLIIEKWDKVVWGGINL